MRKFHLTIVLLFIACCIRAQEEIKLNKEQNGLYTIPCEVNGLKLRFILDTGASYVGLSLTEATFMYKNGYLTDEDFLGTSKILIASGDVQENYVVNLKQVKVGTKVLNNIQAVVNKGLSAPLLLGQTVLSQLGEWSIRDNYLVLHDRGGNDFSKYTEIDWKQRIEETKNNSAGWDSDLKYLLPGVLANDYNTILRAGYVLQYTEKSSLKDEEVVLGKLKELAAKGDKEAIFSLGTFYRHKANSLDDINKSKDYFNQLIDGKTIFIPQEFYTYDTPYINLYLIYNNQLGMPEKAIQILQQGSLLNDGTCIDFLFEAYEDNMDYQNLYQWANKLAQTCTGYAKAKAQYKKAKCLMEGVGINKNVQLGVRLLQQMANSQDVNDDVYIDLCQYFFMKKNNKLVEDYAMKIKIHKFYKLYYLGCVSYFNKDYSSARRNFKQLYNISGRIELDMFGYACCLLGHCYEEGLGGEISYQNAEKCYMYAYEKCDFFMALGYIGDMLSNDKIYKEPNYDAAFGCYMQGAKNNDAYCCYMVSEWYKYGISIENDMKQSEYWLKKAKENGWKD